MKLKITVWVLATIMLCSVTAWADLNQNQVSQLYVSIFGRASEGGGNTYWQTQPDMVTAAKTMLDTQAAKDYFGANLSTNQAFIEYIYLNTLNKTIADDPGGIGYWVNLLDSGTTRGEAVASLVGVIKEYAPDGLYYDPDDTATVAAYDQFTNRVEVSDYMADNVWDAPENWETSTSFSHDLVVTADPATVADAKNAIDLLHIVPSDIELSRTVVELEIGESTNITIGGGSGSFSVVNSNPDVADAFVSGNNLGITGLSGGNITLVVMDSEGTSADVSVTVTSLVPNPVLCGAYVAPGVWREFDCYNLAAIGKTTNEDPFTPSWRLVGGYWQWGRKGPDPGQWYDTNTEHFAHGPTGEGPSETNEDSISSWDGDAAPDDAWSGCIKTPSDPCPEGFRVPTMTTWEGILDNNIPSTVGTWGINTTNYSSAQFFGSDLMLPAAGFRSTTSSGALTYRGYNGRYWSSSKNSSQLAGGLYFFNGDLTTGYSNRCFGFSVRCISE